MPHYSSSIGGRNSGRAKGRAEKAENKSHSRPHVGDALQVPTTAIPSGGQGWRGVGAGPLDLCLSITDMRVQRHHLAYTALVYHW